MVKIFLDLDVITPTFMGGADSLDGIRPSEIKGMMRYWFRAAVGSLFEDINELQKIENEFFGSTDNKSPFKLIVDPTNLRIGEYDLNRKYQGIKYLGFSFILNEKANKKANEKANEKADEKAKKFILPSSSFKINFIFLNFKNLEKVLKIVLLSLYIATALGGFGFRARRGFGSWQIKSVKFENILEDISILDFNLTDYSEQNIRKAVYLLKCTIKNGVDTDKVQFRVINEKYIRVYTKDNYERLNGIKNWEEALDHLGKVYKAYRKNGYKTTLEYQNLKRYIEHGCSWRYIRKNRWNFAFGLPLHVNSRNGIKNFLGIHNDGLLSIGGFKIKNKDETKNRDETKNKEEYSDRLASSVWFSIKRDKVGKYMYILSYLDGIFLSDELRIVFKFDEKEKITNRLHSKCNKYVKEIEFEYSLEDVNNKAKEFVINFPTLRT